MAAKKRTTKIVDNDNALKKYVGRICGIGGAFEAICYELISFDSLSG